MCWKTRHPLAPRGKTMQAPAILFQERMGNPERPDTCLKHRIVTPQTGGMLARRPSSATKKTQPNSSTKAKTNKIDSPMKAKRRQQRWLQVVWEVGSHVRDSLTHQNSVGEHRQGFHGNTGKWERAPRRRPDTVLSIIAAAGPQTSQGFGCLFVVHSVAKFRDARELSLVGDTQDGLDMTAVTF